jgi:hypothetical protein
MDDPARPIKYHSCLAVGLHIFMPGREVGKQLSLLSRCEEASNVYIEDLHEGSMGTRIAQCICIS